MFAQQRWKLYVGLLITILLYRIEPCLAGDWPMFRYDAVHSGACLDHPELKFPLNLKWKCQLGPAIDSSPAIVNGVIYVGVSANLYNADPNNFKVFAINAANGSIKWETKTGNNRMGSSPSVVNNVVFIGSDNEVVYAFNANDGSMKWRFEIASGQRVESSPCISDRICYVVATDGYLYALDVDTGTKTWGYRIGTSRSTSGYSSPAVADGVIYVGSGDGRVYAINTDGSPKWGSGFQTGDRVESSPCVVNNIVYIGSGDNHVYAIKASDGSLIWRKKTGDDVISSPAVVNGVLYVGSMDGNVYALDAQTGDERWRFSTGDAVYSSPAIVNGVVYIGSLNGKIYALDASNGKEKWSYPTMDWIISSPVISNGVLYIASWDGSLYAFHNGPSDVKEPIVYTFPNPAEDTNQLTFRYLLNQEGDVSIDIYDLNYDLIDSLSGGGFQDGYYEKIWDISSIGSGVYMYVFKAGDKKVVKKLTIVK